MQKSFLFLLICFFPFIGVFAQPSLQPSPTILEAMKPVRVMEGQWKGAGWIRMGPQRHEFRQTESVLVKSNGAVVVIDGLGRNAADSTQVIHQAFGVISFDQQTGKYLMRAFRADGNYVDADFKALADGSMEWGFTHPMAGQIRYTIRVKDGKWVESGVMSRDGQNWMPFFEMTLEKL